MTISKPPLVVQKYGGSSLKTPEHIQRVAKNICLYRRRGFRIVVVVSAMGTTTDFLLKLAHKTVSSPSPRELDMLLTSGERVSMSLLAMALQALNMDAQSFTGSQSGIITSDEHLNAHIQTIHPYRIEEALDKDMVPIVAGFQGVGQTKKDVTTLGRGGSDTTAVALGAYFGAEFCEMYTDVVGFLSSDPKVVSHPQCIPHMTYHQALELASLGIKMHPRSLGLAHKYNIPIWVGSLMVEENMEEFLSPPSTQRRMEEYKKHGTWIMDQNTSVEPQNIKNLRQPRIKDAISIEENKIISILLKYPVHRIQIPEEISQAFFAYLPPTYSILSFYQYDKRMYVVVDGPCCFEWDNPKKKLMEINKDIALFRLVYQGSPLFHPWLRRIKNLFSEYNVDILSTSFHVQSINILAQGGDVQEDGQLGRLTEALHNEFIQQ